MVEEPDSCEVAAVEDGALDGKDDGLRFGVGDGMVDAKMVGEAAAEVGDGEGWTGGLSAGSGGSRTPSTCRGWLHEGVGQQELGAGRQKRHGRH